jgi:expansin (peptidoglycan-binding protein)
LDCKTEENRLKQLKRKYDRDSETLGIKKNGYEHLRQTKNVTQGMKIRMGTKRKKFIEDEDIITDVS